MLWLSTALALDWWVEDPEQAEALTAALEQGWPDAPVTVLVGQPTGPGVWTQDGQLVLKTEDAVRVQPQADPLTEVVLVRAWARELDLASTLPPAELAPVADPELPPAPTLDGAPRLEAGIALGPGLFNPMLNPAVHTAIELRPAGFRLGLMVNLDLGESQRDREHYPGGVSTQRSGAGVSVVWRRDLGPGTLEGAVVPSVRWIRRQHDQGPEADDWFAPGLTVRSRWYGRPTGSVTLGVGVLLTQDLPVASELEGLPLTMNFTTAHLEFCVIRGLQA